ncbi:lysophospholipase L1-like esterase [Herbaspirillum sp. CF444]|uniref:SGNH/GDSL hydrolase family protein n=1 Tax=Herbaspirillum sp. CF444 TaxID=1144319 RepID=UPI0002723A85|nr:SGNH/GDSL hydrolase family protein [Herbaspirillum sp. CF444]EJL83462.1 lysophospholipase L1-like esterase [Herbaspirillum sp. CF444]
MRRWLPELLALPLLPWLLAQGRHTRRVTPRMPEAAGERHGICRPSHIASPEALPFTLLAIGESPVAGVGVETQDQAITAQLAHKLATRWQRPVSWAAFGKNGATVSDALRDVAPQLPDEKVNVVLIAFGVNDSTAFRSSARYRQDLETLADQVRQRLRPDLLVIAGVPPLHLFPALPQPLRHVLGLKASTLSAAAQALASTTPQTIFVPVHSNARDRSLMAVDGYHPSASGVVLWAEQLVAAIDDGLDGKIHRRTN